MKMICLLFAASIATTSVFAMTKELDKRAKATLEKCKDEPRRNEVKKEDCHSACFMNGMGYMTNGEINIKNMEETNKQKWEDPETVKKGIWVDSTCTKDVGDTKGLSECSIAYKFGTCKSKLVDEIGLQPPTPPQ